MLLMVIGICSAMAGPKAPAPWLAASDGCGGSQRTEFDSSFLKLRFYTDLNHTTTKSNFAQGCAP
jgi:hypothetical protein